MKKDQTDNMEEEMKEMAKRTAVVALAGVMSVGMLTGCGSKTLDGTKTVATVDGTDIPLGVVSLYAREQQQRTTAMYMSYMGSADNIWDQTAGDDSDETYGDQAVTSSLESIEKMYILKEKASDYNVELTDELKDLKGDADAVYAREITYNAEDLVPVLACPSQVDNIKPVTELAGTAVDQVFIGSCTNGRLEDLQCAAAILKGKKVAPFVKLIVTPASRKIYKEALADGTLETLVEAGAIVTHPGCGLCCGRTGGILTDGEVVVATNNRNFLGRMGTSKVKIFLASPATAAASAIAGKIVEA